MRPTPTTLLLLLSALTVLAEGLPARQQQEDPYRIPLEGEESGAADGEAVFDQELLDAKVAEITPRVETLRGWDFERAVPAAVHTPEQFREFAVKTFEEEMGWEELEAMSAAVKLLGLVEPEVDLAETMLEVLEDAVGGYYDPKTGRFYMISTFNRGAMADIIMAHELTHALDDQHFDLAAMMEEVQGHTDAQFAVTCVIEGSGTSLMNLYAMRGIEEGWIEAGDLMDADFMARQMQMVEEAPPYLVIGLVAPYLEGNKFLARQENLMAASMAAPDDADLRRAFEDPPRSSEQILHPEKYWDPEHVDPPVPVEVTDHSARLGDGWSLRDADTLGEFGCAFLVMERVPGVAEISFGAASFVDPASAGWGGDRYHLYRHEDGRHLLDWHTRWDSEADAREFAEALVARGRAPRLVETERAGRGVRAIFANEGCAAEVRTLLAGAP